MSKLLHKNGKMSTTDGPFAETKEQLGGFYLINARDLNEAIRVARALMTLLGDRRSPRRVAEGRTDADVQ